MVDLPEADSPVNQIAAEPVPDVVPVEHIGGAVHIVEDFFKMMGDGGFTRGRQSCEPDGRAPVAVELLPILFGDKAVEPGDVVGVDIR